MKIEFTCKNYTANDKVKGVIEKKLNRLDKYFESDDVRTKVFIREDKERFTVEVTIYAHNVIRSEVVGMNVYDILDQIMPKLERQIIKYRTRHKDKYKKGLRLEDREFFTENISEVEDTVVKTKQFELKPTTTEEAIAQLELLDHSFYVFLDSRTGGVNVAYKRKNGQYGIIETRVK